MEICEGKKCQTGYLHSFATAVGVVTQFFVSVSVPLHSIIERTTDGKRCLVGGGQLVNLGHTIECSVVAPTTTPTSLHMGSYVLQSSVLRKDPHIADLKLTNGATIDGLSCTCPAG